MPVDLGSLSVAGEVTTIKGQGPDSPPGGSLDAEGASVAAPPGGDKPAVVTNDKLPAAVGDKPIEGEGGGSKPDKPPPYDKDPKWIAARAAQKRLQDILEKHSITEEEMETALEGGKTLRQIIGKKDAAQLVKDSEELAKVKSYWADQEAKKLRENETPEETIARLETENRALADERRTAKEREEALTEHEAVLATFNKDVLGIVDTVEGLNEEERGMLKMLVGMENPMDEVDIKDRGAVKKTAGSVAAAFSAFVTKVKQGAVDEYAAGKSRLKPAATTTPAIPGADRAAGDAPIKPLPQGITPEQAFSGAQAELMEILTKAAQAPG